MTARFTSAFTSTLLLLWCLAIPMVGADDTTPEDELLAEVNKQIAQSRSARNQGDYDAAITTAELALELAEAHGNESLYAQTLFHRGTIDAEQGLLGEALERFLTAREILADLDDHAAHARAVMGIGVTYMRAEDHEGALVFLRETEELVRAHQLDSMKPSLLNNLAIAVQNTEGEAASLPIFAEATELAREQDDLAQVGRTQAIVCRPLIELGRLDEAETACTEAYDYLTADDTRFYAGLRVNLAHLAMAQDDPDAAEQWLEEALELASERIPTVERDALRLWVTLLEARGDYRAALTSHQRLRELEASLLDDERKEQAEQLSMRRQLERSAREIELLSLEKELAALRLQRQGWVLWGTLSALVLVALLALYVWRFFRAKARRGEELAAHDPLTGLLNRRGFDSVLSTKPYQAKGPGQTEVILMADLDHFKRINDQYGHPVGDEVLVAVSERLQRHVRGIDAVVRWGGEEFLIYLPAVDEKEYLTIARRLLAAVSDNPIITASGPLHVHMTIGLARVERSVTDAIQAADNALRRGKESGRNQIVEAH